MLRQNRLDHSNFGVHRRADPVAFFGFGGGVHHPLAVGHRDPDFHALSWRDPALRLNVLPRRVIALWSDKGKHVALASVFTDQRGGQPQPPFGLQVSGHPEDRCRQQVHLVIDDEPPVAAVEQFQMAVLALSAAGDHLVCRDGDRSDFLAFSREFADLILGERGARDQLSFPLPGRDDIGDQDQRRRAGFGHCGRTDQRLAGPTWQHHHPGAARPERVRGQPLVIAQLPALLVQADRVRFTIDVAGEILCGPTDLEQQLLDPAAFAGVDDDGVVIDAGAKHRRDLLVAQHFLKHRAVQAHQRQAMGRVLDQLQSSVAGHGVDGVDEQGLRHRVAGVTDQRVDDLLGIMAGGASIPQCQRCDAVGVDMFGCTFQLGERRDGGACSAGQFMVDFQQHRLIGLHYQWSVSQWRRSSSSLRSASSPAVVNGAAPPHRCALHRRRR